MGSLALRPGDSLTIPKMALSIGFTCFVSSTRAIQATGLLTLAPVGLTPTEHASLCWTHCWLPSLSAPIEHLEIHSCCPSVVVMQPSQYRDRHDLPTGFLDRRCGLPARYSLPQSLVRPPDVEMTDPLSRDTAEMVLP